MSQLSMSARTAKQEARKVLDRLPNHWPSWTADEVEDWLDGYVAAKGWNKQTRKIVLNLMLSLHSTGG